MENERHATWERSGETQNERHTAWEHFLREDGPAGSPQKVPPKCSKNVPGQMFFSVLSTRSLRGPAANFKRHAAWERDSVTNIQKTIDFSIGAEVVPRSRRGPKR